ncbi:MAG: NPCBM/NEW2 domain-containing protein [Anaerohalosphaera sp.]|nr:NPCBM/NEW2 domain-containing protein [Anaerohalosphaera sp.]
MLDQYKIKISEYAVKLNEGVLTPEEFEHLNSMLASNLEFARYYSEVMHCLNNVEEFSCDIFDSHQKVGIGVFDQDLWQALAEVEITAPGIMIERPAEKPVEPYMGMMKIEKPKRTISRLSVYTLILSAAAMLFLMILVLSSPTRPIVATLTDSINAEWISEEEIPAKWDVLKQGELTLVRGLAEITFHDGAVVVVEGPAVIELESPKSMFVASGKISAVVSEYATGFTVNTLSASIVDLGTEFGVSVEDNGSCSLHMFKGKANLIAGQAGKLRTSQIVNENEAKNIDLTTGVVKDIKLSEKNFARLIDSEKGFIWRSIGLDLADIVGGGNGCGGGVLGNGIPTSLDGNEIDSSMKPEYTTTNDNVFVDGVFVPNQNQNGNIQISSHGDVFMNCPLTSGYFFTPISYGLPKNAGENEKLMTLDGNDYVTKTLPGISIHSNQGITFDLHAIRNTMTDVRILKFESICGVADRIDLAKSKTEIFVLVDGKEKFHERFSLQGGSTKVSVKLSSGDRFLTLMTTDGGDGHSWDWALFAEPVLVLDRKNK